MAELSKDTDQSMEDILQSIKRIIADEGEAAPAATVAGSDVLELTELLAEDVAGEHGVVGKLVAEADLALARPDQRLRFGRLAEFDVDHGIDDLYWKPTDAQPTRTGTGLHTGEGLSEQGTLDLGGAQ